MKTLILAGLVVGVGGVWVSSPAFRAFTLTAVREYAGWTEEAREADPGGYIEHVRGQLREDLGGMRNSHAQLQGEQERLTELLATRKRHLADAERMLEDFRAAWQSGSFPVVVYGQSYSSEQLQSQVSLLLEQQTEYGNSIQRIEESVTAAMDRVRELTVQIDRTVTSLSLLDTQKELIVSRGLKSAGEELTSTVQTLLDGNQQVLTSGPVRPLEDLIAAAAADPSARPSASMERVLAYLTHGLQKPVN